MYTNEDIKRMYLDENKTIKEIVEICGIKYHIVQNVLKNMNIVLSRYTRHEMNAEEVAFYKEIAEYKKTHTLKDKRKKLIVGYENLLSHIKFKVTLPWLMQFDDIDKLKILNYGISRERDFRGFTDELYMQFIEKFYYDRNFNKVYKLWKEKGGKYRQPSLDHKIPKSKGGSLIDLDNLHFITWFENRMKQGMTWEEWCEVKTHIQDFLWLEN